MHAPPSSPNTDADADDDMLISPAPSNTDALFHLNASYNDVSNNCSRNKTPSASL